MSPLTEDYGDSERIDCCTNEELSRWIDDFVTIESAPAAVLVHMASSNAALSTRPRVLGRRTQTNLFLQSLPLLDVLNSAGVCTFCTRHVVELRQASEGAHSHGICASVAA